jgi:hypothetical protein
MSAKNLSIAALALIAAAVPSRADDVGLLKFVNGTSAIIRFYVDGSPSCAADPGSYCNDSTSVGNHTLYSRYEDPNYTQATACDSQNVYVPPGGFTWTCS